MPIEVGAANTLAFGNGGPGAPQPPPPPPPPLSGEFQLVGRLGRGLLVGRVGLGASLQLVGRVGPVANLAFVGCVGPGCPEVGPPPGERQGADLGLRLVIDWDGRGRGDTADGFNLRPDLPYPRSSLGGGLSPDVTPWLRSVDVRLGRDGSDPMQSSDDGGTLVAILDNRSGLFNAFKWKAPNSPPAPGRPVMLWAETGIASIPFEPVWGGYLVDVLPEYSSPAHATAISRLTAEGPMAWLGRRSLATHVSPATFEDHSPTGPEIMDALLDIVVAGRPLWPRVDRVLGDGRIKLNVGSVISTGVLGRADALVKPRITMDQLARADGGWVYGDKAGSLAYQSPDDRRRLLMGVLPVVGGAGDRKIEIRHTSYLDGLYNIFETDATQETEDTTFKTREYSEFTFHRVGPLLAGESAIMTIDGADIVQETNVELAEIRGVSFLTVPPLPILHSNAVFQDILEDYPNLVVRVTIPDNVGAGSFFVQAHRILYRSRRADRGFVLLRAQNNESIKLYYPKEYRFPGHLYDTGVVNLARAQRWLTWASKAWSEPRLRAQVKFRVGGTIGSADLLGLSVGNAVKSDIPGLEGEFFIEGVHINYERGRDSIGLAWHISDASPYRLEE